MAAPHELAAAWRAPEGGDRFVPLFCGPEAVANFLALWFAWEGDAGFKRILHGIVLLPRAEAMLPTWADDGPLAQRLRAAWPVAAAGLHALSLVEGRVHLLLVITDEVASALGSLVARVDAFILDDAFTDTGWTPHLAKRLARLASTHALLCAAQSRPAIAALQSAGFACDAPARDGEPLRATYRPRPSTRRAPAHVIPAAEHKTVIIGAGLAGCAVAAALAEHGRRTTLIERRDRIASEASGNPAGLFHGIVTPQDGLHARFNRAAALDAQRSVGRAIAGGGVAGAVDGLLRLQLGPGDVVRASRPADLSAMEATLRQLDLPSDYVRALDAGGASRRCGLPVSVPAWWYPGGGWVDPAGYAAWLLRSAGQMADLHTGASVDALRRDGDRWVLLNADGDVIDTAKTVVLANAADALRLIGRPAWPTLQLRGQLSMLATPARLRLPDVPIAGSGYLLPEIGGQAVFGATAQQDDTDPSVRLSDHLLNLRQLERLVGGPVDVDAAQLEGRTAWRFAAGDRLPIIGAVPDRLAVERDKQQAEAGGRAGGRRRLDQPRFVPRLPGLYIATAFGSRGITWAAFSGRVLAAEITGAPSPLAADLRDAVDPARFVARAIRRQSS